MASQNSDQRGRPDELSRPVLLIPSLLTVGSAGLILYYGIWRMGGVEAVARIVTILFGLVPFVVGLWIAYSIARRLTGGQP